MSRPLVALERAYRRLATGFLFAAFSVGGLFLALLVLPLQRLRSGDDRAVRLRARRIISRAFHLFLWGGRVLRVFHVSVDGAERLAAFRGVVVANHPTLIDVVLVAANCPEVGCLVKGELCDHRWYGRVVRAAGFVRNDRDPRKFLHACVLEVQAGGALLIFPEGTRSPVGGLGTFQRGAAYVALHADCPILPLTLTCDPPALMKGLKWHDVPDHPFRLHLQVGEPLLPATVSSPGTPRNRAVRELNHVLLQYFKEKRRHAGT